MQRVLLQSLRRVRRSPPPRQTHHHHPPSPAPPLPTPPWPSARLHDAEARGARLFHFSLLRGPRLGVPFPRHRTPWRSYMSSPDTVVYGLVGANVAVFMLWRLADSRFMEKNFMISLTNVKNWRLHTLITSSFSHFDFNHMITNMIGLYFFGSSIGTLFGAEFLLKMYIGGALGGSIFYVIHDFVAPLFKGNASRYHSSVPGLGASGAVNAIMLLYIFLFPRNTIYLQFFFPVPAALMGAFLIGSDLWRIKQGDSHISGSAHLGGAVVAALVWARIVKHWI